MVKERVNYLLEHELFSNRYRQIVIEVQLIGPKRTLEKSSFKPRICPATQADHSEITVQLPDYGIDINFNRNGQLVSITRATDHLSAIFPTDWSDIEVEPSRRIDISSCPDPASLILEFVHQIFVHWDF